MIESTARMPDGRQLAFAEYGDPDGRPVMYFHGAPSSRLEPLVVGDAEWKRLGLRLIAPDRPGIGRSDPLARRQFAAWPDDVTSLANALGLERFSIIGNSGGAPYAYVAAAQLGARITSVGIVSGGWDLRRAEVRDNMIFPLKMFWFLVRFASPLA